jgi:hypothetical protein
MRAYRRCLAFLIVSPAVLICGRVCHGDKKSGPHAAAESIHLPSGTVVKLASLEAHPVWKQYFPPDHPWFAEKYADGKLRGMHGCYGAILNGPSAFLRGNGTVKVLAFFADGKREGECRVYDKNKQLVFFGRFKDDKQNGVTCLLKDGKPWLVQEWKTGSMTGETTLARKGNEFKPDGDATQLAEAKAELAGVERDLLTEVRELKMRLTASLTAAKQKIEDAKDNAAHRYSLARTAAEHAQERLEAVERRRRHDSDYQEQAAKDADAATKTAEEAAKQGKQQVKQAVTQVKQAATKGSDALYKFALASLEKAMPSHR